MSWKCDRCNHYTANGKKHECINDEVATLREENAKLKAELAKLKHANNMERVEIGNLTAQKIIQKIDYKDEITKLKECVKDFAEALRKYADYSLTRADQDDNSLLQDIAKEVLAQHEELIRECCNQAPGL